MGRIQARRQKLEYEILSVQDKSFGQQLHHLIRRQFGVCEAETGSVVQAALDYLQSTRLHERGPLDIVAAIPEGRGLLWKISPDRVPCLEVTLSPVREDDAEVWAAQGMRAMQTARLLRLVEQADRAGTTMPLSLLTSVVHQTTRTITTRLSPLWERGLHLPVLGIPFSQRPAMSRLAFVLRGYLQGEEPCKIRSGLFLSASFHAALLGSASRLVNHYKSGFIREELAKLLGLSPVEVESALEVVHTLENDRGCAGRLRELLEAQTAVEPQRICHPQHLRSELEAHLMRRHAFSAARAQLLADAITEAAKIHNEPGRAGGEVVFWAIREGEPAGKARKDCELVAATLPFYLPQEDRVRRGTVEDLKVRKALRLSTSAQAQGALLSLPDLAFLLAMGVNSLQAALSRSHLILPTRGTIMDIGRGVSHRTEIVRLYVQGYSEAQIKQRTQHTYESIASYLNTFSRVIALVDQGLPATHIRKIVGIGPALLQAYISLYRQLDVAENQWKLNLIRQAVTDDKKKLRSTL